MDLLDTKIINTLEIVDIGHGSIEPRARRASQLPCNEYLATQP